MNTIFPIYTLPKRGTVLFLPQDDDYALLLLELGFQFDEIAEQRVMATLPIGWSIETLNEEVHGLLDSAGHWRALFDTPSISQAQVRWCTRFSIEPSIPGEDDEKPRFEVGEVQPLWCYTVQNGAMLNTTYQQRTLVYSRGYHPNDATAAFATKCWCEHWLDQHFPEWRNPFAYWPE